MQYIILPLLCILENFHDKKYFLKKKGRKDFTGNILAKVTNDFLVAEYNEHGSVLISSTSVSSNS